MSWRIDSVWPVVPRRTSWLRDHPPHPDRVHRDAVDEPAARAFRDDLGRRVVAQSFDAAAMRCAVSIAVPDGASIFWSWWSSMISAVSKNGAASSAKRIISTAPIAKFGAMTAFAVGLLEQLGEVGELGSVKPRGADDRVHAVLRAPARGSRGPRRAP